MEAQTLIRPSDHVAARRLAEGAGMVALHLDTAAYHGFNEVGALVWSLLEGGTTFGELVQHVRARFEDAPPDLEADIVEFVTGLAARDLVILEPRP